MFSINQPLYLQKTKPFVQFIGSTETKYTKLNTKTQNIFWCVNENFGFQFLVLVFWFQLIQQIDPKNLFGSGSWIWAGKNWEFMHRVSVVHIELEFFLSELMKLKIVSAENIKAS